MTSEAGALYHGVVTHRRLRPASHQFRYRVFSMLVDVDAVAGLSQEFKFFSYNKFNLFSLYDRDFGDGAGALRPYIEALAAKSRCDVSGKILLMFYPRIFGYAFNPIATFFCYDKQGNLTAVNHEVRNTFGGKHSYFVKVEPDKNLNYSVDKALHVSPFMEMDTRYHFKLSKPAQDVLIAIRQTDKEGGILNAIFAGKRQSMTDKTLLKAFFSYPLMTIKVIFAIHWEAVKLIFKGMKLLPEPAEPKSSVTFVG